MPAAQHRPLVFTCFTVQLWAHAVTASMLSLHQHQQQQPHGIAAIEADSVARWRGHCPGAGLWELASRE
jgi:hypothetical protein